MIQDSVVYFSLLHFPFIFQKNHDQSKPNEKKGLKLFFQFCFSRKTLKERERQKEKTAWIFLNSFLILCVLLRTTLGYTHVLKKFFLVCETKLNQRLM